MSKWHISTRSTDFIMCNDSINNILQKKVGKNRSDMCAFSDFYSVLKSMIRREAKIVIWSYLGHFLSYRSDFLHAPIFSQNMNILFYEFPPKKYSILKYFNKSKLKNSCEGYYAFRIFVPCFSEHETKTFPASLVVIFMVQGLDQ